MKTLVIYYSFSGKTRGEAKRRAEKFDGELCEIFEAKKRNIITAFIPGCTQAMKRKVPVIRQPGADIGGYDRIYIGAPVWAGFPAPAFNAMVNLLPSGKEVGVFLTSGGGDSSKSAEGTKQMIEQRGCTLIEYIDVITEPNKS